jgi:hypothetical protein
LVPLTKKRIVFQKAKSDAYALFPHSDRSRPPSNVSHTHKSQENSGLCPSPKPIAWRAIKFCCSFHFIFFNWQTSAAQSPMVVENDIVVPTVWNGPSIGETFSSSTRAPRYSLCRLIYCCCRECCSLGSITTNDLGTKWKGLLAASNKTCPVLHLPLLDCHWHN